MKDIRDLLESRYNKYNQARYVEYDPISVVHHFHKKRDIEIAGLLTATIAWGQRKSIIANAEKLMQWLDYSPYEFIINAQTKDLNTFNKFYHRTFNGIDCIYFLQSLGNMYSKHKGLESIFKKGFNNGAAKEAIIYFRKIFFELPYPQRTLKHVSDPSLGSAAKRLNMYLRWMVRKDKRGFDFGIWDIPSSKLCMPLDVHTGRVSRSLGLLQRKQDDWKAVEELTNNLKKFDPKDPVKYDFALFGLGAFEQF